MATPVRANRRWPEGSRNNTGSRASIPTRSRGAATSSGLRDFAAAHPLWIVEGCYGSLIEPTTTWCTKLVFLNPGVDACISNCRDRPWEPHKYASRAEQDAKLEPLIEWVRTYPARDDEFGLKTHQAIFDQFAGPKVQIIGPSDLDRLV